MNMSANNLFLMKIAQFLSCALYMCDTHFEFCLETCQLMVEINVVIFNIITFCVSRRRRKIYCGHERLSVCVCVCVCVCLSVCLCLSAAVRPRYCTDPDVTWRCGRGCPLVMHYWADLQSVHGLRCYGNITRTLVTSLRPSRDMTT